MKPRLYPESSSWETEALRAVSSSGWRRREHPRRSPSNPTSCSPRIASAERKSAPGGAACPAFLPGGTHEVALCDSDAGTATATDITGSQHGKGPHSPPPVSPWAEPSHPENEGERAGLLQVAEVDVLLVADPW